MSAAASTVAAVSTSAATRASRAGEPPAARPILARPLLLPALLLWGWQADLLGPAVLLGLLLEAPRVVPLRIDIQQRDFERLWSFTTVLFLGMGFYLLIARQGLGSLLVTGPVPDAANDAQKNATNASDTAITFLRWMPFVVYPFTIAHAWSRAGALPWATFSLYEQARAKRDPRGRAPDWASQRVHPGYFFLGTTLFASTTSAVNGALFPLLLLPVVLLALWPFRNRRYGWVAWFALLTLLAGAAWYARFAQHASRDLWQALEGRMFNAAANSNPDQSRRAMSLGSVGRLQQSNSIILRVTSDEPPGLLREAVLNRYQGNSWFMPRSEFTPLEAKHQQAGSATATVRTLTVSRYALSAATPLAVPGELRLVQSDSQGVIEVNGLGALRLREDLPLVRYRVDEVEGAGIVAPPQADDNLLVGLRQEEAQAVEHAALAAGLSKGMPTAAAVRAVERWFGHGFTYSLWQDSLPVGAMPLAEFLERSHAGHCEFYATATVLLLRWAGVPARYATGYSISEQSDDLWLARGRDAHAWCLAWNDGSWRDVDTTPGIWREVERSARQTWWQGLSDGWSRLWYRFTEWRQFGGSWRLAIFIAGMVVLAWMGWRQLRGSKWRRAATAGPPTGPTTPGLDSEFFALLAALQAGREARPPAEPVAAWLRRVLPSSGLGTAGPGAADPRSAELHEALALHQRLRFDPQGLDAAERARLRELVARQTAAWRPPAAVR